MPIQKEILNKLVEDVETLKVVVDSLEKKFEAPIPAVPIPPAEPPVVETPKVPDAFPKYPIPPDFVATIDEVLNKDFGIECDPLPDTPAFNFKIIVPEKYSNTPKEKRYGADVRSKVISYSEGVIGVRLWAEKVLENLGADTKFKITEDRPFANRPI